MALPSSNISVTAVKQALGVSSNDVGTLCTHNNINKWSRWKPVRFNKVDGITLNEIKSVNMGLLMYSPTTNHKLLIPSPLMWFYNKPRGGNNSPSEPYRIGDFRNYNHDATPPVTSMPAANISINKTIQPVLTMQPVYRTELGGGDISNMRIDDLNNLIGGLYYAVVFEWLGQTYIKTATVTVLEYGNTVQFNFSNEYPLNMMSPSDIQFYSVLSNTMVTTLTLLSDITPAILFSPLPIADNGYNISTIKLTDGSGLIFTTLKVSNNDAVFAPWGPFIDIPYYPPSTPLVANSGLQFTVRVENTTSSNITLPLAGWEVNANPSYWGSNSNYFSFSIVNPDTGSSYAVAPVIPANSDITIGFRMVNILDRDGTNIENVVTKKTETVAITYRNGIYTGNTSVHVTSME